jgi:hypothetical protein
MEFAEWMALGALVSAPLTTLGGVWLGSHLSKQTALDLAQQQREDADRQAVRARQDRVAAEFDERIHETIGQVPSGVITDREQADVIEAGWSDFRSAWRRTAILAAPEIEARVTALDMALFIGAQEVRSLSITDPSGSVNLYPVDVAARDLRTALSAFQRHEPLPEPEGPDSRTLVQLRSLNAACKWMIERGVS